MKELIGKTICNAKLDDEFRQNLILDFTDGSQIAVTGVTNHVDETYIEIKDYQKILEEKKRRIESEKLFELHCSIYSAVRMIPGLSLHTDFITQEQHDRLLEEIDKQPWLDDLSRRVQHYGYRYDYKTKSIDQSMRLGDLPEWTNEIVEKLPFKADQLIVNEYEPGQGIFPHVDCRPCFDIKLPL